MGYIYFIYDKSNIKIGYTKDISQRRKTLQTSNPNKLIILGYICGEKSKEKELHKIFKEYKTLNEWFYPAQELIDYINKNNEMVVFIGWIDNQLKVYKKMKIMN